MLGRNMKDSKPTTSANVSRRAFRDVTNANNNNIDDPSNIFGGGKIALKRSKAILPGSHRSHSTRNPLPRQAKKNSVNVNSLANQPQASSRSKTVMYRTSTSGNVEVTLPQPVSTRSTVPANVQAVSHSSYQHSYPPDDIDLRDSEDPLCATDYVQDMYSHFRSQETKTGVSPDYLDNQTHINERMRSILVDWLVEVHLKFKLVPETLYLTVNLIDRYLEETEMTRPKLQLVGVTCLLIASKYEEIYPPELRDLVYICDRAYSKNEILEMEETVLRGLNYRITIPSAHAFLVRFLKAAHADKKMVQLSCFILDGTLQSNNLLEYLPSQLAAAAVLIARTSGGRNPWSPTLLKYTEYCEEEIIPVARAILTEKEGQNSELKAVYKKYSGVRYGSVASTVLVVDF